MENQKLYKKRIEELILKNVYVTNIQKYSIQDRDGIRTTVFFKGCPLRCSWCHNPETQSYDKEIMYNEEQCTMCEECLKICPQKAIQYKDCYIFTDKEICKACGTCTDYCLQNARNIAGKHYSVSELIKEEKDYLFYEDSGGGVTLSGGEVMNMDMEYVEKLVKEFHKRGIRVNVDTCGFTFYENFEKILKFIDTFLYDLKLIDNELHKKYIGVNNTLILENLKKLYKDKAKIYIRIPLIEGVNAEEKHIRDIIKYLLNNNIKPDKINLLPYHNTGKSKYYKLQKLYEGDSWSSPDPVKCKNIKKNLKNQDFQMLS